MIRLLRGLLAVVLFSWAGRVAAAPAARAAGGVRADPEAGGLHYRVTTPLGPVHVFRPAGYDRRTAGIVVYVHGYYTHVDGAWRDHRLARQFAASGRNAIFIAPEAPASADQKPRWDHLRTLVTATLRRAGITMPKGPLIVAGHSGAYRTIVPWLAEPSWHQVILVDALYGNETDFRSWLDRTPENRMTLVVKGTAKWADPFVGALSDAVTVPEIPARLSQLSRAERSARVLCLRSQYGHFELITEGKVLPVLLARTTLAPSRMRGKGRTPPPGTPAVTPPRR